MVPSVLACLQDRTAGIRNLAEALFAEIIGQVGFEAFQPFLKDIKPAVMTSLSMIFDKYRNTNLSSLDMSDDNMLSSRLSRPPTSSSSGSRSNSKGSSRGKPTNIRASSESDLLKLSKKIPKLQAAEQQSQEISVITGGNKDKRLDYDSKHRWSVEELRQDYIDKLREAMKICFSNDLFSLLFSTDFKKQIESITHLSNLVSSQRSEITEVLDLIFKFIWYKLQEANNPQIYKALLEFNEKLFAVLQEENYQLNDNEAGLILPILCEKSGHNNAMFRQMIRGVIHSTCKIYPSEKVFLMVLQGLSSKNARSKVECLDELTSLIQEFGMGIAQPRDIRALAKFVNSPDNNVRTSAVNTIGEAFKSTGDKLWNLIGEVPDKVKDLLEQRFKTITGSVLGTTQKPKKKDEEGSSKLNTPRGSTRMQLKFEDSKDEIPVFTEAEEVKEIPAKKEIPALVIEKPVIQAPVIEKPKPEIVTPKVNREEERKITALETLITNNDESVNESLLYEPTRFEENLSELDKHIETLRSGDMSSRVDALVAINDLILNNLELHKEEFQKKSNSLIDALVKVIISTFDRPIEEVPLRFAKYFLNVVHKVCCTKLIMREVSENSLFALTEQILKRLLIEELDKLGDKGEGEVMLKTLNGTMLRVLEHCRPTRIFVVLIKLLTKYINDLGLPKMAGLVIRCLLKLTKILNTLIHQLEVDRVLIAMHEYLIEHKISNAAASGDEMGTKTIKTIINELVKLQGENIWESYEPIRSLSKPDSNIERWIQTLLSPNNNITSITSPRLLKSPHDPILASIFSRLSEVSAYNSAIQELFEYIEKNPKADLAPYLSQSPSSLYNKITEDLHRMRDNKNAEQQPQALESYNFQDFQNRLAMMKQRYGLASSNQPAQLSTTLTDLKAKVNTLLSKTSGQDEQADFINEMKERIQNLNRK